MLARGPLDLLRRQWPPFGRLSLSPVPDRQALSSAEWLTSNFRGR
jgi:hypothetical protein